MGDEPPQRVPVDTSGSFVLPNTRAENSLVRVKATDQAGNTASTGFSVIRKGLQVLSVQLAGRSPDAEGRVYVQDDQVAVRITTVGVPFSDRAFAMLLDDKGAVQRPVELERLGGPADLRRRKARALSEGAGKVVRTLRIVFGTDAASARSYSHDIKVVCDREPPSISATIDGTIRRSSDRGATRFPTVRLRICDNVGLSERSPERLVKWTRSNDSGKHLVIVPASPPSSQPSWGRPISFLIVAPAGPPREGRYEFAIEARDRAGNAASRPFAIQLTPPAVALVAIGGQEFPSPVGESSESPLPVRSETVAVTLRAPKTLAPASQVGGARVPGRRKRHEDRVPARRRLRHGHARPRRAAAAGRRRPAYRARAPGLPLENPASQRADELATVYYFFDRDAPSWSVSRANKVGDRGCTPRLDQGRGARRPPHRGDRRRGVRIRGGSGRGLRASSPRPRSARTRSRSGSRTTTPSAASRCVSSRSASRIWQATSPGFP